VDWKKTAIQALWAWLAALLVGIGIMVSAIIIIVLSIPLVIALHGVGIALTVLLGLGLLIVTLRFQFIPYFAHKGYDIIESIKRSWAKGWSPAITVGIEVFVVGIIGLALTIPVLYPVISEIWHTMTTVMTGTPANVAAQEIRHSITAVLLKPTNVALELTAIVIFGAFQPLIWLIQYFGAKGGENEASMGEATEEMA